MDRQKEANKKAWSYRAYEFWCKEVGLPGEVAKQMRRDPRRHLRKHIELLGEVKGKKN